jgi:hypothetical protein
MFSFYWPMMGQFLFVLTALALTPVLAAQAPERDDSPYLESCATLSITRRTVDTVALALASMPCTASDTASSNGKIVAYLTSASAIAPAPAPVALILGSPERVFVRQFTDNIVSGTATISLAMVNHTEADLRIPSWLFIGEAATAVRGKWLSQQWGRSFAAVQSDYRHSAPDYAEADAPSPFRPQGQVYYRLAAAKSSSERPTRLAPSDTTEAMELTLTLNPAIELVRFRLAVRALRASADMPAVLPRGVPEALTTADRIVSVDSVATPFVRDLLLVRFADTLSASTRQILLDRIGGRVVGTQNRDLVVEVDSSANGQAVLRTWSRWSIEIANAWIPRLGIVTPRGVLEATAAAQGMRTQSDTVLPRITEAELDSYPWSYLLVDPAPGATPAEVRLALATVHARAVAQGTGWVSGTVARLDSDTSYSAHEVAARRLHWLPAFSNVEARPAFDSTVAQVWEPRFGGPPPKSEGTAWRDPRVQRFVAGAGLPNVHAIRDRLVLRDHDLVFFTVTYGSANEAYPIRTGLRYGSRIGWLGGTDSLVFRFRKDDAYLQGGLIDTLLVLERTKPVNDRWPEPYATQLYLPVLIVDPAVRISVIRRCARMMYAEERSCAVGPVRAAASHAKDWESLTLLSFLAKDGFGNEAWAAQDTLAAMGPALLDDSSVPPATWAAIAWSLGRYAIAKPQDVAVIRRLLAHPLLGRRLDVLTPLVMDQFPFMADEVANRIGGGDSLRADMRKLLHAPWQDSPLRIQLLREAVRTKNQSVLTVLANLFNIPQGIRAEAARHLPDSVFRHYDTYREPPALR